MEEYITTETDFKEDIIDFINYVFSQSRKPHDFKTLVPKSYADDAKGLGAVHYIAKEDGKIKALVATRIIDVSLRGKTLKYGLIGNVSVHPYSRGKGYMKQLMDMAIEDARAKNIDLLVLAGQRQRYGYFGFENAGSNLRFIISKSNINHAFKDIDISKIRLRPMEDATEAEIDKALGLYKKGDFHCIRPRDEFRLIMRTWSSPCFVLYKEERMIGYAFGPHNEIILEDENDFPVVLKAIFEKMNQEEISITVPAFRKTRAEYLAGVCETNSIETLEMINVLNRTKVLDALLSFKASYTDLCDGTAEFSVEGEAFRIAVSGGVPSVEKLNSTCGKEMSNSEFLQRFFDIPSLIMPDQGFKNWLPLPFVIDAPDSY